MDPFKGDDELDESTFESHSQHHQPIRGPPGAHIATDDANNPFVEDLDLEKPQQHDTPRISRREPDEGNQSDASASSSRGSPDTTRQQRRQHPRPTRAPPVTAANASMLLSSSPSTAAEDIAQEQSAPRSAVRMGKMKEHAAPAAVEADDESSGSETGGGSGKSRAAGRDEESRPMVAASSTSSRNQRRRRSKRDTGDGSIATLAAFGRRILRVAKDTERQDRNDRGHNNSIRLNGSTTAMPPTSLLNRREKALWLWANIENIDDFLREVYAYYTGKGFVCIALSRGCNLLTIGFVITFSTFLFGCIDYSKISHDGQLADVVVPQCVSRFSTPGWLCFVAFVLIYGLQLARFVVGLKRLSAMRLFYGELLEIPEADISTIPWHRVVERLARVAALHPHPQQQSQAPIDVHQVANRLMRQDNYLIALFNRDLLDLSIPGVASRGTTPFLTRSLQWNLNFCLLGFLFDQNGNVRKQFLSEKYRQDLIAGLRRRFAFMAIINALFAPFIVLYLLVYSFLRYFEEYHKNPATLGSRQYTELARWKFREYNELPHLFRRRCHQSYPYASRYIEQFPKDRNAIVARFVSFVAGSFTAVLLLASVIDPDLFVHFQITKQRNVLFYIGVFGGILAASRAMIPDERLVFEPEVLLEAVNHYTHYCPDHWKGRFHSAEVHAEFGKFYALKVSIFIIEVLSVLVTPFILWLSLPKNAPAIIDFFRQCTVHVEGLGYVCSFAVFDASRRGGDAQAASGAKPREETSSADVDEGHHARQRLHSPDKKLERSVLNFAIANDWQPEDIASSLYLEKLQRRHHDRERRDIQRAAALSPSASLSQRSQFYDEALERSLANSRAAAAAGQFKGTRRGGAPPRQLPVRRARSGLQAVQERGRSTDDDDDKAAEGELSAEDLHAGFIDPITTVSNGDAARSESRPKTLIEHVNSLL